MNPLAMICLYHLTTTLLCSAPCRKERGTLQHRDRTPCSCLHGEYSRVTSHGCLLPGIAHKSPGNVVKRCMWRLLWCDMAHFDAISCPASPLHSCERRRSVCYVRIDTCSALPTCCGGHFLRVVTPFNMFDTLTGSICCFSFRTAPLVAPMSHVPMPLRPL
jgi:hypothetical protein